MSYNSQLKSIIKGNNLLIEPRLFKNIEFILYCLYKHNDKIKIEDMNLYFTQFFQRYEDEKIRKKHDPTLYILRKYFHQYYNKKRLEIDLNGYFQIPDKFRLFEIKDDKFIQKKTITIMVDRKMEYEKMLKKYLEYGDEKVEFIQDSGYYERVIRTGNGYDEKFRKKTYSFDLNMDNYLGENKSLPLYKGKKIMELPLDFDWYTFKQRLGGDWSERPDINIVSSDGNLDNIIKYNGQIHIAGLLGSGKSTYIIQETVRLLEGNDIKIGIIKSNVSEVIKTYEALRDLGIRAVPIIGTTQIDKHFRRYTKSKFKELESFEDFSKGDMDALDYLSSNCLLSYYSGDYDIDESLFPCTKLKKQNSSKIYACPLFENCSFYRRYLDLIEADVWITTPHSLILSKASKIVDPQERTYYELFHDCLDIIFVDEADYVQEEFDNQFITDEIFYGNKDSIMNKFQRVDEILREQNLANVEFEGHRWSTNCSHLTQLLNRIEYLIINSPSNRKYLIDKILTPRDLYNSILNDIENIEAEKSQEFIKSLKTFLPLSEQLELNNQLMKHELYLLYDSLSKCPNMGNTNKIIDELIEEYFKKYNLVIKQDNGSNRDNLFRKKFELFIYLVLLDYYFRIQNKIIENIAHKLREIYTIYSSFRFINKNFIHLITESIIGNVFGYKFNLNEGNHLEVHLFNYSGIGRSLLEQWHQIKKELGMNGPSIVMLSGTSYAPKSAHYHIEEVPSFILKSEKQEGEIKQFINIKYDNLRKPIKISGISDRNFKKEKINELTDLLYNDFKYEIDHWMGLGDNRKILIIVNSYEQCRIVGDSLRYRELSYRVLSRNNELDLDEINASSIEELPENNPVDILVAPLSIISRGYNILKHNGDSYFGSVFFLIRPYTVPGDLAYNYRILNSAVIPKLLNYKKQGYPLEKAVEKTRRFAFGLESQFNNQKFWKYLSDEEKEILSWFTFIPIKQTIGRTQRNGCSCRVFYCDGSFVSEDNGELTTQSSMLKAWEENLININEGIGKLLYGEFLNGLSFAINDFEDSNENEEVFY